MLEKAFGYRVSYNALQASVTHLFSMINNLLYWDISWNENVSFICRLLHKPNYSQMLVEQFPPSVLYCSPSTSESCSDAQAAMALCDCHFSSKAAAFKHSLE